MRDFLKLFYFILGFFLPMFSICAILGLMETQLMINFFFFRVAKLFEWCKI